LSSLWANARRRIERARSERFSARAAAAEIAAVRSSREMP